MVTKSDKIIFGAIALLVLLTFVFRSDVKSLATGSEDGMFQRQENDGQLATSGAASFEDVQVLQQWDLPPVLKEISGIAYIDNRRFACVQDESGTIYIFNINSKKIEKEIPFAGAGDYEGIALKGDHAYVVRADGTLYEVDMNGKNKTNEYSTSLTAKHNVEGLCYDKNNDRLLLAIKNDEPSGVGYKGIYAFNLANKKFQSEPAFKLDLSHKLLSDGKKKKKVMMPSEIEIHPQTNEIYITDGPKGNLLILDKSGTPRQLVSLGKKFAQPEGITFSPKGELFISNEGTKKPGNILKVELK